MKIGTNVTAFSKSKHAGQSGTVVADYGNYIMVIADDQSYAGASINSSWEKKVFQIDKRYITNAKGNRGKTNNTKT